MQSLQNEKEMHEGQERKITKPGRSSLWVGLMPSGTVSNVMM